MVALRHFTPLHGGIPDTSFKQAIALKTPAGGILSEMAIFRQLMIQARVKIAPKGRDFPMTSGKSSYPSLILNGWKLAEHLNKAGVEFLRLDVEVGLTFSGIALQAQDSEKRARNLRAARKAYDTVLRLMDKVTLTEDGAKSLARNLFQLKCELVMLGEVL